MIVPDAYTLNIHSTGNVNRSLTWELHSLDDIFRFTGSCHWISSGTARNENVNKMTTFPFQRWIWCCESNYSFTRYILISITFVIIGKGNSLSPIHRSNQCWPTDVTTMNIHQWKFNRNTVIFLKKNVFEKNVVCYWWPYLFRFRSVKCFMEEIKQTAWNKWQL